MHVPLFCLAQVSRPLTKKEIGERLHDPCDVNLGKNLDYVDDYKGGIDPDVLAQIYNDKVFELVQEDEEEVIHHVYRMKKGAVEHVAEVKLDALKDELCLMTPQNVLKDYWRLETVVIDPLGCYVCNLDRTAAFDEYPEAYPFDEWFIKYAEEGKMYQIVQIFDAHV